MAFNSFNLTPKPMHWGWYWFKKNHIRKQHTISKITIDFYDKMWKENVPFKFTMFPVNIKCDLCVISMS